MRTLLPVLALIGCGGADGDDDSNGGCDLVLTVGTGSSGFSPLSGGPVTLVHGGQGGWHVEVAGRVEGSTGEVAVTPIVRLPGQGVTLTGDQRPASQALVGDTFVGVLGFLTQLPTADPQEYICGLEGAALELEVMVEDLGSDCTTSAVATGIAALDPSDVAICEGLPTETGTTDTGVPPIGADPKLRAIHVGPGLPGQDMLGNGNPGNPPLTDLQFGQAWPGSGSATRPPQSYVFEFFDHGDPTAWLLLNGTMSVDSNYSLIVHGTRDGVGPAPGVLFVEDDTNVPLGKARIRWTHVATALASDSFVLRDTVTSAVYAGGASLAYGDTVVFDEEPVEMTVWADLDNNGSCGPGETVFAPFQRDGGDYFHVMVVNDESSDEVYLLGHTLTGATPIRLGTPCP